MTPSHKKVWIEISLMVAIFLCFNVPLVASKKCVVLTSSRVNTLAHYVAEQYEMAPDITVEDDGIAKGCFRRLIFKATSPHRALVLYLSPDQNYLVPQLMDLSIDPEKERWRMTADVGTDLLRDSSPSKGPSDAEVTIVEFADFECPYCRQLAHYINSIKERRLNVRVVFKELPLPSHSWARQAAVAATCAGLQNQDAFWTVHDFWFAEQASITSENFPSYLNRLVTQSKDIDAPKLFGCIERGDTVDVVRRDESLARKYQVLSTPTVFINGVREVGFRSRDDFERAIDQAVSSAKAARNIAPIND